MVFTADYPVLGVLSTMIIFFCWVAWIWLPILVFFDLCRRDASGWVEAAWVAFVIVLPLLGCVRSIVAGSEGRSASEIRRAERLFDSGASSGRELEARALAWPRA